MQWGLWLICLKSQIWLNVLQNGHTNFIKLGFYKTKPCSYGLLFIGLMVWSRSTSPGSLSWTGLH